MPLSKIDSDAGTVVLQFSTCADTLANWSAAIIRRLTHSPFSHVDLVLPSGNLLGASDMGPKSPFIEGNPCGVAVRPPDYQVFGYRRQMVLKSDRAPKVIEAVYSQLGKPFDSAGLKDFMGDEFPGVRDWRQPVAWYCSELFVWALEEAQFFTYNPLAWPKNRISPTDLLILLIMDERWINRDEFWNPIQGLKLDPKET
jgi:hypothetical protein